MDTTGCGKAVRVLKTLLIFLCFVGVPIPMPVVLAGPTEVPPVALRAPQSLSLQLQEAVQYSNGDGDGMVQSIPVSPSINYQFPSAEGLDDLDLGMGMEELSPPTQDGPSPSPNQVDQLGLGNNNRAIAPATGQREKRFIEFFVKKPNFYYHFGFPKPKPSNSNPFHGRGRGLNNPYGNGGGRSRRVQGNINRPHGRGFNPHPQSQSLPLPQKHGDWGFSFYKPWPWNFNEPGHFYIYG